MKTDVRELSNRELYEQQQLSDEFEERRVSNGNRNGSFSRLKDIVFTGVIFGFAAIVWGQIAKNEEFTKEIAALKVACMKQPVPRIPAEGLGGL
jgi:hypothetical protein